MSDQKSAWVAELNEAVRISATSIDDGILRLRKLLAQPPAGGEEAVQAVQGVLVALLTRSGRDLSLAEQLARSLVAESPDSLHLKLLAGVLSARGRSEEADSYSDQAARAPGHFSPDELSEYEWALELAEGEMDSGEPE